MWAEWTWNLLINAAGRRRAREEKLKVKTITYEKEWDQGQVSTYKRD